MPNKKDLELELKFYESNLKRYWNKWKLQKNNNLDTKETLNNIIDTTCLLINKHEPFNGNKCLGLLTLIHNVLTPEIFETISESNIAQLAQTFEDTSDYIYDIKTASVESQAGDELLQWKDALFCNSMALHCIKRLQRKPEEELLLGQCNLLNKSYEESKNPDFLHQLVAFCSDNSSLMNSDKPATRLETSSYLLVAARALQSDNAAELTQRCRLLLPSIDSDTELFHWVSTLLTAPAEFSYKPIKKRPLVHSSISAGEQFVPSNNSPQQLQVATRLKLRKKRIILDEDEPVELAKTEEQTEKLPLVRDNNEMTDAKETQQQTGEEYPRTSHWTKKRRLIEKEVEQSNQESEQRTKKTVSFDTQLSSISFFSATSPIEVQPYKPLRPTTNCLVNCFNEMTVLVNKNPVYIAKFLSVMADSLSNSKEFSEAGKLYVHAIALAPKLSIIRDHFNKIIYSSAAKKPAIPEALKPHNIEMDLLINLISHLQQHLTAYHKITLNHKEPALFSLFNFMSKAIPRITHTKEPHYQELLGLADKYNPFLKDQLVIETANDLTTACT